MIELKFHSHIEDFIEFKKIERELKSNSCAVVLECVVNAFIKKGPEKFIDILKSLEAPDNKKFQKTDVSTLPKDIQDFIEKCKESDIKVLDIPYDEFGLDSLFYTEPQKNDKLLGRFLLDAYHLKTYFKRIDEWKGQSFQVKFSDILLFARVRSFITGDWGMSDIKEIAERVKNDLSRYSVKIVFDEDRSNFIEKHGANFTGEFDKLFKEFEEQNTD